MKRWRWVAVRLLLCDLKYLLSLWSKLVDELRKYSWARGLGDSVGYDSWMQFIQSGDWDKCWINIKLNEAWNMSDMKLFVKRMVMRRDNDIDKTDR